MFRIVTYNIRSALGTDGIRSIQRIGNVLQALSPDVVCLQEVDQRIPRSLLSNQPKYLSVRLGMQAAFQRNISFGFGGYGNAILVRPVILHYRCHRLPGKGEPRGLLQVTANLNGENIVIFCTHLSTDRDTRIYQAKHVREIIKSVPGPKILCGDMNDVRGSQTIFELLDETVLRDVAVEAGADNIPTFSTGDPRRVDFIFADIRFVVKSYQVVESNDSDHKPVVADLELP